MDSATYRRMRDEFEFEGPQVLNVKGKGEVTVYRLIAHKTRAAADAAHGNA